MEGSVYNKTQEYEKKSMLLKTCHIVEENIIEDSAQCQINLCHGMVIFDTQYDAINWYSTMLHKQTITGAGQAD